MTEERFSEIYSLVLQRFAEHPTHTSPICQICKSYESETIRIKAIHHELIKQPCGIHKNAVSSTCPECLLWAAHDGDLQNEKEIDFSVTEPDNTDFCMFLSEQVSFGRIRDSTENFSKDWLAAMTVEEQIVDNLTTTSDANMNQKGFSESLSKKTTIDLIAKRYGLKSNWVDGKYSILFKTRPPMHWDSQLSIWKFGTMSQMVERQMTGKEVCVVCTTGLVEVHRVSQDGPPPQNSHVFYPPCPKVTIEQEMIVKKMTTRSVFGLNQYNLVKEIQEFSKHGDAFRTGDCAVPWCSECRILLRGHSKQKPRSTKFIRTRSTIDTIGISVTAREIPDQINNHTQQLLDLIFGWSVHGGVLCLCLCLAMLNSSLI